MQKQLRHIFAILSCILFPAAGLAQNIGINSTGASPAASAGLDIDFSNKGLLIPRVYLSGTTTASPVSSPDTGLLVFNKATAGTGAYKVVPGFYYWCGSHWVGIEWDNQTL